MKGDYENHARTDGKSNRLQFIQDDYYHPTILKTYGLPAIKLFLVFDITMLNLLCQVFSLELVLVYIIGACSRPSLNRVILVYGQSFRVPEIFFTGF